MTKFAINASLPAFDRLGFVLVDFVPNFGPTCATDMRELTITVTAVRDIEFIAVSPFCVRESAKLDDRSCLWLPAFLIPW